MLSPYIVCLSERIQQKKVVRIPVDQLHRFFPETEKHEAYWLFLDACLSEGLGLQKQRWNRADLHKFAGEHGYGLIVNDEFILLAEKSFAYR